MKKLFFVTVALLLMASFAWGQNLEGTISGTVLAQTDSLPQPLTGAHVMAYHPDGQTPVAYAAVEPSGSYTLHVPYGTYQVKAEASHFLAAWYNNVPERSQATNVGVGDFAPNPTDINFLLIPQGPPPPPPGQGTISGVVTGQHEGGVIPLRFAHVLAYQANVNMPAGAAFADSMGHYTLHLTFGQYVVRAEAMGYQPVWYNNVPERSQATAVAITDSINPTGIDFLLLPPPPPPPPPHVGTISGTVSTIDDSSTVSLAAQVFAYGLNEDHPSETAMTDRSGHYTLHVVVGQYQIKAEAMRFVSLWYNNVPERAQATVVAVTDSVNPTGIDFLLSHQGPPPPPPPPPPPVSGISGNVTDAVTNLPIHGAMVTAINSNNRWMHFMGRTDSLGAYLIGAHPGEYIVQASARDYNSLEYPTHVTVPESTIVSDIDFALTAIVYGSISGTVTDTTGAVVTGAFIEARKLGMPYTLHTRTDSTGAYTLVHVMAGNYRVRAYKPGYIPGAYPDSVVVAAGQAVTGINIVMGVVPPPFNGTIAGLVTDDSTGAPVAHAAVVAIGGEPHNRWRFRYTFTNDDGTYLLDGLSQVPYKVFCAARGYVGEFYNNVRNFDDATPVTPNATGINFGLAPLGTGPRALGGYVLIPGNVGEATVVYATVDDQIVGVTVTDPDGYYSFEGIEPGSYAISAASVYGTGTRVDPVDATLNDVGDADVVLNATSIGEQPLIPTSSALSQNYPNPFNAQTMIAFDLANAGTVQLDVYNMIGQKIVTLVSGNYNSGSYNVIWNGRDAAGNTVSSGIYYYRLKTDNLTETKKMTLLK
jgi:hypothetical protein